MGSEQKFIWQRRILFALSLIFGVSSLAILSFLLQVRFSDQPKSSLLDKLIPLPSLDRNSPIKAVQAQQNQDFNRIITQLKQEAKEARYTFLVPKQFQGKILNQANLPRNQKAVALTFDDGPWPGYTEQILKILNKNQIKATFFLVGLAVQEYPQIAKKIVQDGHAIANHTWNHWYRRMDVATAAREIERTADIIYKTTGAKTSIFRPPGGFMNNGLVAYALKKKYLVAMWSADSNDYRRPSVERLASNVVNYTKPGGIVLMHDGGGDRSQTVKALPKIIVTLKRQGYQFVTVPELLELQNQQQQIVKKHNLKIPASQNLIKPKESKPAKIIPKIKNLVNKN